MAVVLIDGFDYYTAAQAAAIWGVNFTSMGASRFGSSEGQCARLAGTTYTRVLPSTYTEIYAGFALRFSPPAFAAINDSFDLRAGATNVFRVGLDGSGHLVIRNSSGTVIATSPTAFVLTQWHYVEVHLLVNGASGSCSLRLDGAVDIADTVANFGSSAIDRVCLVGGDLADYDDLYVVDTSGADNKNFLGGVRVKTIYPDGDGAHTAWTPTGGGSHYTQVNEATPDDDTSYVASSTPGDVDTYTLANIDGGATVYAVQANLRARKDDAATRQVAPVLRKSSTDHVGATDTLSSSYQFFQHLYDKDPDGSAWTATTVNNLEAGVKEIA